MRWVAAMPTAPSMILSFTAPALFRAPYYDGWPLSAVAAGAAGLVDEDRINVRYNALLERRTVANVWMVTQDRWIDVGKMVVKGGTSKDGRTRGSALETATPNLETPLAGQAGANAAGGSSRKSIYSENHLLRSLVDIIYNTFTKA